ncbi:MAG: hypothetical protein PHI59_04525 [Candidatus Omnitrophica bacterium]|nr:hypothetical protein [Candidatus Omnitrophota bacterium]
MTIFRIKNYGLTLVELLVATFVGMLTFSVLFYVSFTIQNSITVSSGILGITETGRFTIDRISNDIREAKEVKSSYGSYVSGDATLVLEIPVANISGVVTGFDTVIYALDSGDPTKLRHIVYATAGSARKDTSEIVTENVKNLLFSSGGTELSSITYKNAVKTLSVKITTAKIAMGFERINEVTTSVSLRNKK